MSPAAIVLSELFFPLVPLIIYARMRVTKKRLKAAADELAGIDPNPPFSPKPEPPLNLLTCRFSEPQRAYLRQQLTIAKGAGSVYLWAFSVFCTAGLLPGFVQRFGAAVPFPQRVWYSYLFGVSFFGNFFGVMVVLAGLVASIGLSVPSASNTFIRTRPVSMRFMFYARIIPALLTVLATLLAGMVVSFSLLLVFYGPVWLHLLDTPAPHIPSQAMYLYALTQASVTALFLSLLTTTTLIFSAAIAFAFQPLRVSTKRIGGAISVPLMLLFSIVGLNAYKTLGGAFFDHYARILFIDFRIGTPPPYSYAIIPILLSAALLFIAQFWASRIEL